MQRRIIASHILWAGSGLGGDGMIRSGTVIGGRYTVVRELGRGGMGIVYLVIQNRSAKLWAMKVLRLDTGPDEAALSGLRQEYLMLRRLRHPGLPELADVIEEEGRLCLIMTYIEGISMQQMIREKRMPGGQPYDANAVISWSMALCGIMAYLHEHRPPVLYLDLKPSNVMVTKEGRLCLIDLGASIVWRHGFKAAALTGTVSYAPPELIRGGKPGPWSDIYSFGRFLGALRLNMDAAARAADPAAVKALEAVEEKCLSRRPEDRFASFREISDCLAKAGKKPAVLPGQKRRWVLAACSLLALTLALPMKAQGLRTGDRPGTDERYLALTEEAGGLADTDFMKAVTDAADLAPERPSAYLLVIGRLSADGVFDADDLDQVRGMLYDRAGEGEPDHLALLKQDPAAYGEVAYALGLAIHEGSDDAGLLSQADFWFGEMLEASSQLQAADDLQKIRIRHASLILQMDECLQAVSRPVVEPEAARQLWLVLEAQKDLAGCCQLSRMTRLHVLEAVSGAVYDHAAMLISAGISADMQLALLAGARADLKALGPFAANERGAASRAEEQLKLAEDQLAQIIRTE